MGEKSLTKGKYLRKLEFVLIVSISFSLYFLLKETPQKEEVPKIQEPETVPAQVEPEKAENEKKVSVYFDRDVQTIVEKMIKSAEKTIDAATYTYSRNEITELLEKRASDGSKCVSQREKTRIRLFPRSILRSQKRTMGSITRNFSFLMTRM